MKALILAAGLGARLRPLTREIPKALAPVAGVPLLERNLKQLAAQGVTEFIVNVHYKADMVEDFLRANSSFGLSVAISDERGLLRDTGGALRHAAWFFDDGQPLLLYNVDVLTSLDVRSLLAHHRQRAALATLAVSRRPSSRYFLFDSRLRLHGWRSERTGEERLPSPPPAAPLTSLAFGGVHVISPAIFPLLRGFGEAFSIIDAYLRLAPRCLIAGFDMRDTSWIDVGSPTALQAADAYYRHLELP
jgi:NDP-sugar pyrophosphorylase family protein